MCVLCVLCVLCELFELCVVCYEWQPGEENERRAKDFKGELVDKALGQVHFTTFSPRPAP